MGMELRLGSRAVLLNNVQRQKSLPLHKRVCLLYSFTTIKFARIEISYYSETEHILIILDRTWGVVES